MVARNPSHNSILNAKSILLDIRTCYGFYSCCLMQINRQYGTSEGLVLDFEVYQGKQTSRSKSSKKLGGHPLS